ncbi:MAG: hypothetical protein AAF622_09520 [Cyanobacteria bacterium P01_C01_bin.147]
MLRPSQNAALRVRNAALRTDISQAGKELSGIFEAFNRQALSMQVQDLNHVGIVKGIVDDMG